MGEEIRWCKITEPPPGTWHSELSLEAAMFWCQTSCGTAPDEVLEEGPFPESGELIGKTLVTEQVLSMSYGYYWTDADHPGPIETNRGMATIDRAIAELVQWAKAKYPTRDLVGYGWQTTGERIIWNASGSGLVHYALLNMTSVSYYATQ